MPHREYADSESNNRAGTRRARVRLLSRLIALVAAGQFLLHNLPVSFEMLVLFSMFCKGELFTG